MAHTYDNTPIIINGKGVSIHTKLAEVPVRNGVLVLVHRTPGWEPAGAGTRDVGEAWGALFYAKDGTTHGAWFKTPGEATEKHRRMVAFSNE